MEGGMMNRLSANALRQLYKYQDIRRTQLSKIKVNHLVGVAKRKALMSTQPGRKQQQQQKQQQRQKIQLTREKQQQQRRRREKRDDSSLTDGGEASDKGEKSSSKIKRESDGAGGDGVSKTKTKSAFNDETPSDGTANKSSGATKTSPRTAKPTSKVIEMRKLSAKKKVSAALNKNRRKPVVSALKKSIASGMMNPSRIH